MLNPTRPRSASTRPTALLEQPQRKLDPASFSHVRLRVEGAVARLTLQRPEHNLLNQPMLQELAAGLELVSTREDVKVIVLEAAGKVFCGGIDVGEYTAERAFQLIDAFHHACLAMVEAAP